MQRLSAQLFELKGEAEYRLQFFRDEGTGHSCILVYTSALLQLICQRCFGPEENLLETESELAVVGSIEEARQLPNRYDPVLNEQSLTVLNIVEDELLLALPTVVVHPVEKCPVRLESETNIDECKKNPFAELSKLQVKNRSK